MEDIVLETPRLRLRPFAAEDSADLYAYARDPAVGPPAGWPPHESYMESWYIIQTVFSQPSVFAMELKENRKVIGSIGFVGGHPAGEHPDCPDDEIGYALSRAFWGRGLTGEAMAAVERGRARGTKKALVIGGLQAAGLCLVGGVTFVDYGGWGVATALGFYLFRNFPGARLCQLALLTYINGFAYMGMTIPVTVLGHVFDFPTQAFAILALVPIWLYNGRKGGGGKALQWGCYVFYPAHLLVLWLLFTLR